MISSGEITNFQGERKPTFESITGTRNANEDPRHGTAEYVKRTSRNYVLRDANDTPNSQRWGPNDNKINSKISDRFNETETSSILQIAYTIRCITLFLQILKHS